MPRLSFTLRDMFWLTLVVGLALGWWLDHNRLADRELWKARAEAMKEGWSRDYGEIWGWGIENEPSSVEIISRKRPSQGSH